MKKIILLVVAAEMFAVLWGRTSVASSKWPTLIGLSSDYVVREGDECGSEKCVVRNLPPTKTQMAFPFCDAFAAQMVYQQFVCKQSNSDCKSLDPDKTFSPMSFAALGTTANYKKENGTGVIPYSVGGSAIHALASLNTDGGFADACYPYDQFVSKFKKNAAELRDAFERLRRDYYDRNKATEGSICMNCLLKDLEKNFNIKIDNKEVLAALGEDIFDKFLYDIFVGSCKKFMDPVPFSVKTWPERSDFSYNDMIQKMKGLFKDNTPVVIGACLDDKVPAEQCKTRHEFVVAGYRKYCKPDGTCRETLRIPNSWGQDWLDANNDGWVDAKNLYEYIYKQKGVMGWLTPQG